MNNAIAFGAMMAKEAVHVTEGKLPSRVAASTLGRLNPENLIQFIMSRKAYHDPTRRISMKKDDERRKKHERSAELIGKTDPEALKDTVLRLGGGDLLDDIVWRKNQEGEKRPWHRRLGGRVWQNPRTGPLGKLMGTAAQLPISLTSPLRRSSHYNPYADAAQIHMDEPAVTEHELGHALDFNTLFGVRPGQRKEKGLKPYLKQQGKGTLRDLYMAGYMVPGVGPLVAETRANLLSQKALAKSLKNNPKELAELTHRRMQVLPAGYGSYVGNALLPGGAGALGGMAAGKVIGLSTAAGMKPKAKAAPKPAVAGKIGPKEEEEDKPVSKAAAFGAWVAQQ